MQCTYQQRILFNGFTYTPTHVCGKCHPYDIIMYLYDL